MNSKTLWNVVGIAAPLLALGTTRLWFGQIEDVAIPENRALFVGAWLLAVVLGLSALVMAGWIGRIAALPGIAIGLLFPFTVSISEQILPAGAVQVGQTIPAFSAPDENGEIFDSARLRGNPVLIKFFRAHW